MNQNAYLVTHPDDLVEGRSYRVYFISSSGKRKILVGSFDRLRNVAMSLYACFTTGSVPWLCIRRIEEGEQL